MPSGVLLMSQFGHHKRGVNFLPDLSRPSGGSVNSSAQHGARSSTSDHLQNDLLKEVEDLRKLQLMYSSQEPWG